ncbi:unnamed protein product, partial [Phaeothamnion confervicola]
GGSDDGDELQPYALDDDFEDLAPVPRPIYLCEVLELLQSRDEDDTYDKHAAAL